jgi:drug/metabolite transporter (DMT)-like permease
MLPAATLKVASREYSMSLRPMNHRAAVLTMIAATLLWSIAGVVTRQFDSARSFEVTFWRSAFNALALAVLLMAWRGPAAVRRTLAQGGRALWASGLCWCVMYTAFMLALTLTTVANVLITMALAPLFTALLSRGLLGHRLAPRTWAAIVVAGIGIAWMYGRQFSAGHAQHLLGTAVALAVPLASAANWTLLQRRRDALALAGGADMLVAVWVGAVLSAVLTLPMSLPFAASPHDLGLLALLGVLQLAIPCLMAVQAARVLSAPEASLLALLEVVFGVLWAWWGAAEAPGTAVLGGGLLVLGALASNEALALRQRGRVSP